MKWINKLVDVPKLVHRIWLILWITLAIFVVAKLCFNMWYPIVIENENIIKICSYIDNNELVKYIIMLMFYLLNANIIFLTFIRKLKFPNKIFMILFNIANIIGYFVKGINNVYGIVFEVSVILISIFVNIRNKTFSKIKWNILFPIIIYLMINIWQLNIFFIRGINDILNKLPSLIFITIQIDYYIFLIITWIGVVYYMGLLGYGWLWGKSEVELLALKEKELAKEKPDLELIKEIDKALEKAKKNEVKA